MTLLDQGFVVIKNCFSQSECDGIITQVRTITTAGTRCLLDNDWCRTLAVSVRDRVAPAVPALRSLVAVQCTFFNKSTTNNWFVAYHQDRSIPVASSVSADNWQGWSEKEGMTFVQGTDELLAQMMAVRLHVDDCRQNNGPLRVIPGSHRAGTLLPRDIDALRDSSIDYELIAGMGDVVIMRPLLLHASSKSDTIESRRVLHFLFGPTTPTAGLEWRCTI